MGSDHTSGSRRPLRQRHDHDHKFRSQPHLETLRNESIHRHGVEMTESNETACRTAAVDDSALSRGDRLLREFRWFFPGLVMGSRWLVTRQMAHHRMMSTAAGCLSLSHSGRMQRPRDDGCKNKHQGQKHAHETASMEIRYLHQKKFCHNIEAKTIAKSFTKA